MNNPYGDVTVTRVRVPALDGYPLGGFFHHIKDSVPSQAAIFATGGGVRAEVYRHFLSYLAGNGIPVLAVDYRGIGESRPARLRGLVAGFEDWGEYDVGGAIAWMGNRFPGISLTGMGHSIGALLIGAPLVAQRLDQFVLIAPHTGFHGDYRTTLRWIVRFGWGVTGPPLRWAFGFFPARMLGLGEDLPARVSMQWGTHTSARITVGIAGGDALREQRLLDQIGELRKPALAISLSDDPWATEFGVRRALHAYRSLLVVRRVIEPFAIGRNQIGHWGFFKRSSSTSIWPSVLRFITTDRPLCNPAGA